MARGWEFQIYEEEELYNPSSKIKGADQCTTDLRLSFAYAKIRFSQNEAGQGGVGWGGA